MIPTVQTRATFGHLAVVFALTVLIAAVLLARRRHIDGLAPDDAPVLDMAAAEQRVGM